MRTYTVGCQDCGTKMSSTKLSNRIDENIQRQTMYILILLMVKMILQSIIENTNGQQGI